MDQDKVLQIIKPLPDSHFLLLPCWQCESDNVAYIEYLHLGGARWRVQCLDCGATVAHEQPAPRHQLQVEWNGKSKSKRPPQSVPSRVEAFYQNRNIYPQPKPPQK